MPICFHGQSYKIHPFDSKSNTEKILLLTFWNAVPIRRGHTAEMRYSETRLYAFVNCAFPSLLACASGFRTKRGMTGERKGVKGIYSISIMPHLFGLLGHAYYFSTKNNNYFLFISLKNYSFAAIKQLIHKNKTQISWTKPH